jgi:magnesium chelatase subunit D
VTVAFPLTAIVGQEALVEALLINAVAPEVGGVLVRGERGTAKSTAVRGLAPLLPPVGVAEGEPFAFAPGARAPGGPGGGGGGRARSPPPPPPPAPGGPVPVGAAVVARPAPLVELPIGTTLDRLVGALDLGRALAGEHAFEPGLLARAHRGILYVDEVNLLPDHLVDALLDAAASGIARVEREAVSVEHDARFILVGTMNVEEGDLRPQLLDRFGLGVEVGAPDDPAERAEIVRRRLAFERDPRAFAETWAAAERALATRIADAQRRLPSVRLPERELLRITGACAKLGVDGVRGDIVSARAARALAALDGAEEVGEDHVRRAVALAVAHRRRRDPLDGHMPSQDDVQRALDEPEDAGPPDDPTPPPRGGGAPPPAEPSEHGNGASSPTEASADGAVSPNIPARPRNDAPLPARLGPDMLRLAGAGHGPAGRRARGAGPGAGSIDSRPARPDPDDLAMVASLRARLLGESQGLREHVRAGREGAFLCLVVDASGSMGAQRRLARVKGALAGLLRDAYARRDRVAVVAFRDEAAEVLIPPGAPLEQAAAALASLPTGGRTPLAAGLRTAELLVRREHGREPGRRSVAVVLTDGRVRDPDGAVTTAAASLGRAATTVEVVDTEEGRVRVGLAAAIARAAGGRLHQLIPSTSRRAA